MKRNLHVSIMKASSRGILLGGARKEKNLPSACGSRPSYRGARAERSARSHSKNASGPHRQKKSNYTEPCMGMHNAPGNGSDSCQMVSLHDPIGD